MTASTKNKTLNIILWVAQILLAAMFLMAGIMKSTTPIEQLSQTINWVKNQPGLVRFIGIMELMAALGLILPSLLRIKPVLTPIAATGLMLIMALAIPFHISRGETSAIGMNILFLLVAFFIAWGRSRKVPIAGK